MHDELNALVVNGEIDALFTDLLPTTKETPSEAEVVSHQLLLRGGFIRKLTSGDVHLSALGLAAMRKVTGLSARR